MRVASSAVSVLFLALASRALAQPPPAEAEHVLVLGPIDAALAERLDGQLNDLSLAIRYRDAAEPAPTFRSALALADASGALSVVHFEVGAESIHVFVVDARTRRLFARRVTATPPPLEDSAALESVALIVRASLQALAAGAAIGDEVPEGEDVALVAPGGAPGEEEPGPPPDPEEELAEPGEDGAVAGPTTPPAPEPRETRPQRGEFVTSASLAATGLGAPWPGRFAVGAGACLGPHWSLRGAASVAWPRRDRDAFTSVRLFALELDASLERRRVLDRVLLALELRAGWRRWAFSTRARQPGVSARADATRDVALVGLRGHLDRPLGASTALRVSAGVDAWLPGLELAYEVDGARRGRNAAWPLAPTLGIGLRWSAARSHPAAH